MEEISKKDLLTETGISYGQLYRWKREGLIPEEWFVKRSAFTGQETFFPRERMLTRVQAILSMKDNYSLDEIRAIFGGDVQNYSVGDVLLEMTPNSRDFVDALELPLRTRKLDVMRLAAVVGIYEAVRSGGANADELHQLASQAVNAASEAKQLPTVVLLLQLGGRRHFIMATQQPQIVASSGLEQLEAVYLADIAERIKSKMAIAG
jgi:DNA-binding transcriptional MerR regulator